MKPNKPGLWREKSSGRIVFMESSGIYHDIRQYAVCNSSQEPHVLIVSRTKASISFLPHGDWEQAGFPSDNKEITELKRRLNHAEARAEAVDPRC